MRPISVVGMTNGAKKRAAERMASHAISNTPSPHRHAGLAGVSSHWTVTLAFARWAYRVGERLHPCCCLGCVYGYWPCSGVRPARGAR